MGAPHVNSPDETNVKQGKESGFGYRSQDHRDGIGDHGSGDHGDDHLFGGDAGSRAASSWRLGARFGPVAMAWWPLWELTKR